MEEKQEFLTYLNGEVMPHSRAVGELQRAGLQSAGGYYDNERTFGGKLFKLRRHLERLYNGLEYSRIDPGMSLDEMESVTMRLLEDNRPLIPSGCEVMVSQVVSLAQAAVQGGIPNANVIIYIQPLDTSVFAQSYVNGVSVVTPATYVTPAQASESAVKQGIAQQVFPLMTTREGSITECRGANFMFICEGRIKLPDRSNVLPGVSMHTVLELADSLEMPVDEGIYSTYDLYTADEAFVSSTRYCMLPVAAINGYSLGGVPGPVTQKLLDEWRRVVGVDFIQQSLDSLNRAGA